MTSDVHTHLDSLARIAEQTGQAPDATEPWFDTQHRRNNLARDRAEGLIALKPLATGSAEYRLWPTAAPPGPGCPCPACPHARDDHDGMGCTALDYQCSCRVSIVSLTPLPRWEAPWY